MIFTVVYTGLHVFALLSITFAFEAQLDNGAKKHSKMKFANKHISFIYEGLRVLHETGLDRSELIFESHLNRDDDAGFKGDVNRETSFPLHVILQIRPADFGSSLKNFRKAIEVSLIRSISIHCPTLISVLARDPSESYDALIRRFNAAESFSKGEFLNPHNPEHVGRRGLKLIEDAEPSATSVSQIAWGVALIGWSSLIIGTTVECTFCPRRSAPDSMYCFEHSQSDCDNSNGYRTSAKQYTKYRTGKMAKRIANKEGWLLKTPKYLRRPLPMDEILRPRSTLEQSRSHIFNVYRTLEDCPRVLSRLGGASILSLNYTALIETIRATLNPFESNHIFFFRVVICFEKWFEFEEKVRHRMRGRGVNASKRVREAISMAKKGATKTEIARKLGVGQSTVSSWIKKHESFRLALMRQVGSQPTNVASKVSRQPEVPLEATFSSANIDWHNIEVPHVNSGEFQTGPFADYSFSWSPEVW